MLVPTAPMENAEEISERKSCYIEPAPKVDVLFDQLECLVNHVHGACPADCAECARLAEIETLLLAPFRIRQLETPHTLRAAA